MIPEKFYQQVMLPGIAAFPFMDTPLSRILLLAIAGQESGWSERLQQPIPYARGYWQFETGGISALIGNAELIAFCIANDIPISVATLHEAVAWSDNLAYTIARLTLWQDPLALPAHGDCEGCWNYYLRCWRPGRPRPDDWAPLYNRVLTLVS